MKQVRKSEYRVVINALAERLADAALKAGHAESWLQFLVAWHGRLRSVVGDRFAEAPSRLRALLIVTIVLFLAIGFDATILSPTSAFFVGAAFPDVLLAASLGRFALPCFVACLELAVGSAYWRETTREELLGLIQPLKNWLRSACVLLALTMPVCSVATVSAVYGAMGGTLLGLDALAHLFFFPVVSFTLHMTLIYVSQFTTEAANYIVFAVLMRPLERGVLHAARQLKARRREVDRCFRKLQSVQDSYCEEYPNAGLVPLQFDRETTRIVNSVYAVPVLGLNGRPLPRPVEEHVPERDNSPRGFLD